MSVKLTLSGSVMTGFWTEVEKEWMKGVSEKTLIEKLKEDLYKFLISKDMWELAGQVRPLKLHIHAPWSEEYDVLYICTCSE